MNELVFESFESCMRVAKELLTDCHYVVMISREETIWILNYLYSDLNDRNDVVFMDRCEFDEKYTQIDADVD